METFRKIPEVCQRAGTSRATIYRAVARGELRLTKFGRATRIADSDLARWLDSLPRVIGAGDSK
jgi:excisionase family DNA binding protein